MFFRLSTLLREVNSTTFGKVFKYLPDILYNEKQILNFV